MKSEMFKYNKSYSLTNSIFKVAIVVLISIGNSVGIRAVFRNDCYGSDMPNEHVEQEMREENSLEKECLNEYILTEEEIGRCPDGMIFVREGYYLSEYLDKQKHVRAFCIDEYEYPNKKGEMPKVRVNQHEAQDICEKSGKRLCAEIEWEKACRGPCGNYFPYGKEFANNACNTINVFKTDEGKLRFEESKHAFIVTIKKSGDYLNCRSYFGVYDMSGNVNEWTSMAAPEAQVYPKSDSISSASNKNKTQVYYGAVKGGSSLLLNCADTGHLETKYKSNELGFRCCQSAGD